jgi:opacity protein-like surface antigen
MQVHLIIKYQKIMTFTRAIILLTSFLFSMIASVRAQDIDQLLQDAAGSSTEYATATFKSTRIINGHSIERMPNGQLDVRISHRFGQLNSGSYELWGLDQSANICLALEYGITDWVMVGISRSKFEKIYDGFLKFSILRQSKGERNMPVSLSYFASSSVNSMKWTGSGTLNFWDRVSYVQQLLIARKFNERLSFEINPTYIHRNMVNTELDPNDIWAVGAGARFKITKRLSLNAEYYYVIPPINDFRSITTYNPLSIGVDIETGGHVFSIMLTNSLSMIEKGFIGETTSSWQNAGIHLGFNISRVFALK